MSRPSAQPLGNPGGSGALRPPVQGSWAQPGRCARLCPMRSIHGAIGGSLVARRDRSSSGWQALSVSPLLPHSSAGCGPVPPSSHSRDASGLEAQPEGPRSRRSSRTSSTAPGPRCARQEHFARVVPRPTSSPCRTSCEHKALAVIGGLPAGEVASRRPCHRHDPDGRLSDREARLREPARHPRHRPRLRARRTRREEAGDARRLRPLGGRQGYPGYQEIAARLVRPWVRRPLLGSRRPGRAQPVLGRGARPQPLQSRLRRARGPRQLRDDRRHEPRALHAVGRGPASTTC